MHKSHVWATSYHSMMRLQWLVHRIGCSRLTSLSARRVGHLIPHSSLPARSIGSFIRRSNEEGAVHGSPRSLIKLHVSEEELKHALNDQQPTIQQTEQQSTQLAPAVPPVTMHSTISPSAIHPTVASYSRDDVLSAEPDTLRALSDAGHPFAQHYIGILLMTGSEGQPLDRTLAAHYLLLSTQHEQRHVEPLSLFFLAGLLEEQQTQPIAAPFTPSEPTPLSLYKQYCDRSTPSSPFHYDSMFRAARLLLLTNSAEDETSAGELMERAARGGHAEAMLHVAKQRLLSASSRDSMEEGRQAAVKDEQEAREWMQRAKHTLEQQLHKETHSSSLAHSPASARASSQQQPTSGTAVRTPHKKKRHR